MKNVFTKRVVTIILALALLLVSVFSTGAYSKEECSIVLDDTIEMKDHT